MMFQLYMWIRSYLTHKKNAPKQLQQPVQTDARRCHSDSTKSASRQNEFKNLQTSDKKLRQSIDDIVIREQHTQYFDSDIKTIDSFSFLSSNDRSFEILYKTSHPDLLIYDNSELKKMINNEAAKYGVVINYFEQQDIVIQTTHINIGTISHIHKGIIKRTLQPVIVKIIDKQNVAKKNWLGNVINEIIVLNKIKHGFIVQCYGVMLTDISICIVLENCHIGSIKHLFCGKFNDHLLKCATIEIITALIYLHQNKIIHRDIKEDNILVGNDGHVRLCDFNCAKIFGETVSYIASSYVGTPLYMPPEIKYGNYSFDVDWYELGVTIVKLILCEKNIVSSEFHKTNFSDMLEIKQLFSDYNTTVDNNLLDLLGLFLNSDQQQRIGRDIKKYDNILKHVWFRDVNVAAVIARSYGNLCQFASQ